MKSVTYLRSINSQLKLCTMTTSNISISQNRVAVELNGKTAQFVIWDLEASKHEDLKAQIKTAFTICPDFDSIVKHLQINGYDAALEDIYNS